MSIADGVKAVREALKADPDLLPLFEAGETLTIQRNVGGRNVLMYVTVKDACSIGPNGMVIRAALNLIGESSYADGRVARQAAAISRLQERLEEAETLLREAGWTQLPYEYQERAERWLRGEQREGTQDEQLAGRAGESSAQGS